MLKDIGRSILLADRGYWQWQFVEKNERKASQSYLRELTLKEEKTKNILPEVFDNKQNI
ncbi:hypothetical protein HNP65_000377 [Thermosipho japonicus]|uniref:Uncharacterized protein n=1 Tax=Thermosipho japonicus TaxID=90323 RepID=A0A841GIW9_9BACT|nr:hypothetical protein [Thermosipho japonicus]MBB6061955.1 hypothetical protein [Thermosipho japonicus]